jgi:hypothetical protein
MEGNSAYFAGVPFLDKELFLTFYVPQTPRRIEAVDLQFAFVLLRMEEGDSTLLLPTTDLMDENQDGPVADCGFSKLQEEKNFPKLSLAQQLS